MKTINEILEKVRENDRKNISADVKEADSKQEKELIKIRDILLQTIEKRIEEKIVVDPYAINFSEKIEAEKIILNSDANTFMFCHYQRKIFEMVFEELEAAGYQNIGSNIQQECDYSIFYVNILLYNLAKKDRRKYRIINATEFVNFLICVISMVLMLMTPLFGLGISAISRVIGFPITDGDLLVFRNVFIGSVIITGVLLILQFTVNNIYYLFRKHVLETYQK